MDLRALIDTGSAPLLIAGLAGGALCSVVAAVIVRRERRRGRAAERRAQEAQARLGTLTTSLHEAVVTYGLDRHINFANPAFEALTGYRQDQVGDLAFLEYVHPDDRALLLAEWDRLDRGETIDGQEYRIVARDGQVKWSASSWRPLQDDEGQPIGYFGTEFDITERKQSEHELRMDLELFQTVMEVQQAVVAAGLDSRTVMGVIADRAHRLTHADSALIEMVEGDGLVPKVDTGAPAGAPRVETSLSGVCVRTGEVQRCDDTAEDRRVDPDIPRRLGIRSLLAVPLKGDGRVLGVLKVVSGRPHAFTDRDARALRLMAGLMGAALEHAAFFESRQARFKQLVDAAQEGICVLDERDSVTYVNQRMADLLDYPKGSVLGRSLYEFMDPSARGPAREAFARQAMGGAARLDLRFRRADGGDVWAMVSASPLLRKDGAAVGTVALVTDVTERRLAEDRLRRTADRIAMLHDIDQAVLAARSPVDIGRAALGRLRRMVPSRWGAIVLFDAERDEAQILAGYDHDHSLPAGTMPLAEYGTAEARRRGVVQCLADLTAVEAPSPRIQRLADGGIRSLLTAPLLAEGEVLGELSVGAIEVGAFGAEHREILREVAAPLAMAIQHGRLRDELLRRTAEHERTLAERGATVHQLSTELDAIIGGLAHEVQAPIRQLHGFTSLLLEDAGPRLEPGARHTASRIREAAQRLGAVVEDLLDLARIGREAVLRQPADLRVIAEEVLASESHRRDGGRIAWEIDELGTAACDPAMVKAALGELVANAVKFTRGRPEPRIRIERTPGPMAGITVRDNGVGFDPACAPKLFGMFSRLHRPDEFAGTGLGLVLVRRIAEKHGGQVWAEGEPGRGAAFSFTLGTARAEP
jgi:PAS domain S-box-containing protein